MAASLAENAHTLNAFSSSFAYFAIVSSIVTRAHARDFAISANPSSLTITHKTSGTLAVTLTSVNGFTGNITLSATVSPVVKKGPTAILSPVSVTLTANGQGTSTLTVSAGGPTPPGTYTVTVMGVSVTLTYQVEIMVTVLAG